MRSKVESIWGEGHPWYEESVLLVGHSTEILQVDTSSGEVRAEPLSLAKGVFKAIKVSVSVA